MTSAPTTAISFGIKPALGFLPEVKIVNKASPQLPEIRSRLFAKRNDYAPRPAERVITRVGSGAGPDTFDRNEDCPTSRAPSERCSELYNDRRPRSVCCQV